MTCIQLYYILVLELSSESDVNNKYVDQFFGDFLMKPIHSGPEQQDVQWPHAVQWYYDLTDQ